MRASQCFFVVVCLFCLTGASWGKTLRGKVAEANRFYEAGQYGEALQAYTDAQLQDPNHPQISLNMGAALYRQKKYDEALEMFHRAAVAGSDTGLTFQARYNLASTLYRQGKLKESLDAFKEALRLNPDDEDTKYNVEFVEQKIKEMLSDAADRIQKQESQEMKASEESGQSSEGKEEGEKEERASAQAGGADQTADNKENQKEAAAQGSDPKDAPEAGGEKKAEAENQPQDEETAQGQKQASQAQPDPSALDKDEPAEKRETASQKKPPSDALSREQAERFLDLLDQENQIPVAPKPDGAEYRNYRQEKDW